VAGLGVTQRFARRLKAAEDLARWKIARAGLPDPTSKQDWGVVSIEGFRINADGTRAGFHTDRVAVDINVKTNPFIMHERNEGSLDVELAKVFERIAGFILLQRSIVPARPGGGQALKDDQAERPVANTDARKRGQAHLLYPLLEAESEAMKEYFSLLEPTDPEGGIDARHTKYRESAFGKAHPDLIPSQPETMRLQIARDYLTMGGTRKQLDDMMGEDSKALGVKDPKPLVDKEDRPFVGKDRDPVNGFLDLRIEMVEALSEMGMRWGAIDFGGESGDVMHFDCGEDA
jgi:hypothetical protein